jgi:hypothetical protein
MKGALIQAGARPLADYAMRVQLAARSSDLKQVIGAIRRLQAAMEEHAGEEPATRLVEHLSLRGES